MQKNYINNFLDSMFEDKLKYIEIHGTESLFDPQVMLVSDAMSENKELLAQVLLESLQKSHSTNKLPNISTTAESSKRIKR
jgi:hypothetical protein